MLKMTPSKKEDIIEWYVSVYGEEYRELITKRVKESKVIVTYFNKHERACEFLDKEIDRIVSNFKLDGDNKLFVGYGKFLRLLEIKKIAASSKNGDIECAKKLQEMNLLRYSHILKLPKEYSTFTSAEEIKYISENIERFTEVISSVENLWNQSEEKKQVEEKLALKEEHKIKAQKFNDEIKEIDNQIIGLVKKHLERLAPQGYVITDSLVNKYLTFLNAGWDKIISSILLKNELKSFCRSLNIDCKDFEKFFKNPFSEQKLFPTGVINKIRKLQENKNSLILENSSFSQNFNTISKIKMSNGNKIISESVYDFVQHEDDTMAYTQAYVDEESKDIKHVIVLPYNSDITTIIHEFGHVIQTQVLEEVGNTVVYRTGLNVSIRVKGGKNYQSITEATESGKAKKRGTRYENGPTCNFDDVNPRYYNLMIANLSDLNEVLNEYFTIAACKNAEINEKSDSKYSSAFHMLGGFIKKYKPEIIKCLMGGDLLEFVDFIGEENLIALNKKVTRLFSSPSMRDGLTSLKSKAKENGVKVEDLVYCNNVELNNSERNYLKLLEDTNEVLRGIDAHVAKFKATQQGNEV